MTDDRQFPDDQESPEGPDQTQDPTMDTDPDATVMDAPVASAPGESPGTLIGRYRLVKTLGEGGFGTVFLAQQLEPVSRQVALKIIKLGMDTKQVIARFEAERQALAMMDHPGIAKVYDAGSTEAGRPYFVMELVKGVRITKYCDTLRLSNRARLELFRQVCAAVQHAHQKGVIHRDIKPSNVLVTEVEGVAVPKIIDFGIAKATSHRLTEKTIFTQESQFLGTPAYMSPEQAEISEVDIDTRSDIYSLGVLLYELLAGATPFDSQELLSAGYGEIQRIIREVDPPLPSLRASSLGERLEETADYRQMQGRQLVKRLRGELDWIVMKCLEKDRTRRYETASGLARDVERFLSNEPVAASPPSRRYRFQKLVARNRSVFVAGTVMVLLLAAGVVGTGVGLIRAQKAEQVAITEAATSKQVATFLTDMLAGVGPSASRGRDTEMLEEILLETHDKIGEELEGQPQVEGEIRSYLGVTYFDLGQYEKAREQYVMALELLREAHGEVNGDVAKQYSNLGLVYEALLDFEAAEENDRKALDLRLELYGENSPEAGESKLNLANLMVNDSRYEEAEPLLMEALAIQRETLGPEDENIAISLNSLGNLMQHLRRYDEAGPYYDEALAMHTKLLGEDHPFVITDGVNLGWLHYNLGDYEEAARYFTEAEAIGRRVYDAGHPRLLEIITARAQCEQKLGNTDEAEALLREAWAISSEINGPDTMVTGDIIYDLAGVLADQGQDEESAELFAKVVAIQKAELGEYNATTLVTQHNIANRFYNQGDYDEAIRRFRVTRREFLAGLGTEDKRTPLTINSLGRALRARGDLEEAEEVLQEAMDLRVDIFGEDHLLVQVSRYDMLLTLHAQGRLDEAVTMLDVVIVGYAATLDSTHYAQGQVQSEMAELKLDQGHPKEALGYAQRGYDLLAAAKGEDDSSVMPYELVLITAMGRTGDVAGADARLEKVIPRIDELDGRKRAEVEVAIGQHQTLAGRYDEAEKSLLGAYEVLVGMNGADHFETRRAAAALVELYEAWAAAGSSTAGSKAESWRNR